MFFYSVVKWAGWICALATLLAVLPLKVSAVEDGEPPEAVEPIPLSMESRLFLDSLSAVLHAAESRAYEKLSTAGKETLFGNIRSAVNEVLREHDCHARMFSKKESERFTQELGNSLTGVGVRMDVHPVDARPHETRLEKFLLRMQTKYGKAKPTDCTFLSRLSAREIREYKDILTALATIGGRGLLLGDPHAHSPAEKAGLKKGWMLQAVNGTSLHGMPLEEGVSLIKGPAGTRVKLGLLPPEEEQDVSSRNGRGGLTEVTITRAQIDTVSVLGRVISARTASGTEENIGYVKVTHFPRGSADQFEKTLNRLGTKKLVIDVRNNGGGYTEEVLKILDHFVPPNHVLVTAKKKDGSVSEKLSAVTGPFDHRTFAGTIVVLINGGSASASEILAGVLRDYKLATIIGEKTEGKGSIQEVMMLPDGTLFKITVAHYALPSGILIDGKGIEPDVKVVDDPNTPGDEAISAAVDVLLGWKSSP